MKKNISIFAFSLFIIHCSFFTAEGETWQEMMDSTKFYQEKLDYQTALDWAQKALEKATEEFGELDTNFAENLNIITEIFIEKGDYNEAVTLGEQYIKKLKTLFENGNPHLAKYLSSLAIANQYVNKQERAKELINKANEMIKKFSETNQSELAYVLDRTGAYFETLNDLSKAEMNYKEALNIRKALFSDNGKSVLRAINNLGYLYINKSGKISEAEIILKEGISIYRDSIKNDYIPAANCLFLFGDVQNAKQNDKEAEKYYKESIQMMRRIVNNDNKILAFRIKVFADFLEKNERFREAEPLYVEALNMKKRIYGSDKMKYVTDMNHLAIFYTYFVVKFKLADSLYKDIINIYKENADTANLDYADILYDYGDFFSLHTKYAESEKFYNYSLEVLNILKKDSNYNKKEIEKLEFEIKSLLCSIYNLSGSYSEVDKLFNEINKIFQESAEKDTSSYIDLLLKTIQSLFLKGEVKKANILLNQAKELLQIYNNNSELDNNTNLIDILLIDLISGNFTDLEITIKKCREILQVKPTNYYFKKFSFALDYIEINFYIMTRKKDAEQMIIKTLNNIRSVWSGDYIMTLMFLLTASYYYIDNERFSDAKSYVDEAYDMSLRLSKEENVIHFLTATNKALILQQLENYYEAEELVQRSLRIMKKCLNSNNLINTPYLINFADFYNKINKNDEAENLYLESIEIIKNETEKYFTYLNDNNKKSFWNIINMNFESFMNFVIKITTKKPQMISELYDFQIWSKGLIFNNQNKIRKRVMNSNNQLLIDRYNELCDKKVLLVDLYSKERQAEYKRVFDIDSIENITNNLEKELSLKSEDFTQSYEKKKITWRTIQGLLKPDEATVELVRFRYNNGKRFTDTIYYAFLIVSELTEEHPDLILLENGHQLENEYYNDYRAKIKTHEKDTESFSRYWEKLHEKLKGYKKIYFSADGIYNKLNPSTLLMPDGNYLLDIQDIQQVNSTKDIILSYYQNRQESNIYNSAVLIGNPNFSLPEEEVIKASKRIRSESKESEIWEPMANTRGIQLTRLPGTEKEIKDVAKFLEDRKWDVKSYLGDMALKTAVKEANSPRVLHIATHGMFLEDVKREKNIFGFDEKRMIENPLLRSGLFFTGADNYLKSDSVKPEGDENGLLTAYEAMNLDLDRTELVILSACETGLGEIKNGEGVFGLRQAFQQAGAKTVVMSLWTVNDEATQELMSNFYANWVTGMTKRDAFARAQQSVRSKYPEPYYWGAFVMVGE